jgi:hypothetical protein
MFHFFSPGIILINGFYEATLNKYSNNKGLEDLTFTKGDNEQQE